MRSLLHFCFINLLMLPDSWRIFFRVWSSLTLWRLKNCYLMLRSQEKKPCLHWTPCQRGKLQVGMDFQFKTILLDPLLALLNHSFVNGILPRSLRETNISVILKKGKPPDNCASYRPIALLNPDLKLLSKILALRLEKVLPFIIKEDQTGFVKGRKSSDNIRKAPKFNSAFTKLWRPIPHTLPRRRKSVRSCWMVVSVFCLRGIWTGWNIYKLG